MKTWIAAVLVTATVGACKENAGDTAPNADATAQPAATAAAETTPAMTAGTGGAAAAAATPEGAAKETNPLGLKLPKIDRSVATWKFGVPAPDPFPAKFDPKKDYFATMHTTLGDITVKFFPEVAPKHVTSFLYLSEIGYYDDAPFHRVCEGFMMQGGDPSGQGTGGPGYKIPKEFNARKHVKGILSMARTNDPNSAGSQFFLMFDPAPFLDNQYTVFGQVVEGMNVVDLFEQKVAVKDPSGRCRPKSLEKIKTVDVFTKDKT